MNYFIAPRSGEKSYIENVSSLINGVQLQDIKMHLTTEGVKLLSAQDIIYAWGNREGTKSQWEKMQTGDTILFYAKKKIVMVGEEYYKQKSDEIGKAIWPVDEKGNPWKYTFFVKNLKYVDIPIQVLNKAADIRQTTLFKVL